jgi:hypothetical protein
VIKRPERTASGVAKRFGLLALIATVLVALLGFLAPTASASPTFHPQTRVAAIEQPTGQLVAPHSLVLAVQGRERAPNYDRSATGSSVAAEGGALENASEAAFQAADNADDWTVSAKHLAGSGGNYSQFAAGTDPNALAADGLRSPDAQFYPNASGGERFVVKADLGQVIGTRGETWIKIVVANDGQIITAYPIKGP